MGSSNVRLLTCFQYCVGHVLVWPGIFWRIQHYVGNVIKDLICVLIVTFIFALCVTIFLWDWVFHIQVISIEHVEAHVSIFGTAGVAPSIGIDSNCKTSKTATAMLAHVFKNKEKIHF